MRKFLSVLYVGLVGLILTGSAAVGAAKEPYLKTPIHLATGGGRIQNPDADRLNMAWGVDFLEPFPGWPANFVVELPFAQFDRMMAETDREMAVILKQARMGSAFADTADITQANLRDLPPGTMRYSYIATSTPAGQCAQMFQISVPAAGGNPQVISRSSGDCTALDGHPDSTVADKSRSTTAVTKIKNKAKQSARFRTAL